MLAKLFMAGIKKFPMERCATYTSKPLYDRGQEVGLIITPVEMNGGINNPNRTKQQLWLYEGGIIDNDEPRPHDEKALGVVFMEAMKSTNPAMALYIYSIASYAKEKYNAKFCCVRDKSAAVVMELDFGGQPKKLVLAVVDVD